MTMTTVAANTPLLSLVVPTTGKEKNLFRCLDSIVNNAPASLLTCAELIVFVNADPIAPIDFGRIEAYLNDLRPRFASLLLTRSERFELTAEESGYAASSYASGKYIWVVGDARLFLPEGLVRLDEWLKQPTAPAAFFNTVWYKQNGLTDASPSIHMLANECTLTYKQFVMQTGINYMATAMGAWIYERQFLDRTHWSYLIKHCGPHFSHVAVLLATMGETAVQCFTTFLYINEAKAYHSGDDSEWVRYSSLAGTYRFYAWTLGLVRQFEYLIQHGVYTYADVRRSMCSEGTTLRRQVNEIYIHLLAQLRYGWVKIGERMTPSEFDEIMLFLSRACPEKVIANGLYKDLYCQISMLSDRQFMSRFMILSDSNEVDERNVKLASLVVSQVGDQIIRLHPRGYISSPLRDNQNFMLGYKFLDAPLETSRWHILAEEEFKRFSCINVPKRIEYLFPIVHTEATRQSRLKKWTRHVVTRLYRFRLTYRIISTMPGRLKKRMKSLLM